MPGPSEERDAPGMCGIAGIVDGRGRFGPERLERIAAAMGAALAHRGPDGAGTWIDPSGRCALAHRRLAVRDPSERGHQPMVTADGGAALVFNGELYEEGPLREELSARGALFRSTSDAEVALHQLAGARHEALARLDGMYALASWSVAERRLLLARDPFGKKPLYLRRGDGWLAFASELHALACVPDGAPRLDREALAEYLLLQYVHAPRAIWEGTHKLVPGGWLEVEARGDGLVERHGSERAFEPASPRPLARERAAPPLERSPASELDALEATLLDAVSARLVADVPLGAFLSGGIDSTLVVALLRRRLGVPVRTFSIGFAGSDESEHEDARAIAAHLGADHHEQVLEPDALALLPDVAASLDEPLGDSSCLPTWLLSRFTRRHVTVALSGDGGDELFGGYGRYRDTLLEAADWRRRARHLLRHLRPWRAADAYCSTRWLMFPPDDVERLVGAPAAAHARALVDGFARELAAPARPLVDRMRALDARTYLPGAVLAKVDRMAMAFALEVRCPFLDRRVAAHAARLPPSALFADGTTKPLLRALAARFVPARHALGPKRGFGLPGRAWSRDAMLAACEERLLDPRARVAAHLDPDGLAAFVARQRAPAGFSVFQVWTLLVLEAWLEGRASVRGAARAA